MKSMLFTGISISSTHNKINAMKYGTLNYTKIKLSTIYYYGIYCFISLYNILLYAIIYIMFLSRTLLTILQIILNAALSIDFLCPGLPFFITFFSKTYYSLYLTIYFYFSFHRTRL